MEYMEWIFNGIGTAIFTGIVGFVTGGCIGYKIGIKNTINQKQKAKENSTQTQIGQNIVNNGNK